MLGFVNLPPSIVLTQQIVFVGPYRAVTMFTLDQVVPWGRSFGEYQRMFAISETDLRSRILGCADGPAAFNAEATRRGATVVSSDPLYACTADDIDSRIEATYGDVIEQTRRNADQFMWEVVRSVDELGRLRMEAMREFLADYVPGKGCGRYVEAGLPDLPFPDDFFDLALCSHFLFLYAGQLGAEFHESALIELCRVAREVRIFPLVELGGRRCPLVEPVTGLLRSRGHSVSIERVPYEFQRGGNEMMRVRVDAIDPITG